MNHLLDLPRPLIMAHRGDAVHAPENTFAAFGLALDRGAQLLETDLWFTQDGVLVCHHDRTLDRTTDGTGAIPEMTLAQVKQARVTGSYCGQFNASSYRTSASRPWKKCWPSCRRTRGCPWNSRTRHSSSRAVHAGWST